MATTDPMPLVVVARKSEAPAEIKHQFDPVLATDDRQEVVVYHEHEERQVDAAQ